MDNKKIALAVVARRRRAAVLLAIAFCATCAHNPDCSYAQPEGPVTIENGLLRLTVNPSVGRIVDFGRVDGPNLLRVADASVLTDAKEIGQTYESYGGDQLWPAQQATWGKIRGSGGTWPPLKELDGPNWTIVDQGPRHITIRAPETPLLGLTVERTISLKDSAAEVAITNRFTRTAIPDPNDTHEVMIWSVTGLTEPEFTMIGLSPDRPNRESMWTNLVGRAESIIKSVDEERAIRFDVRSHGPSQSLRTEATKIGAYGDWLAAVYAADVFLQRSAYDVEGRFPDDAALEIYSTQKFGAEYIELEVLSRSIDLKLGESLSNRVDWHLLDRPLDASDDQLAAMLRAVPEPSSILLLTIGLFGPLAASRRSRVRSG